MTRDQKAEGCLLIAGAVFCALAAAAVVWFLAAMEARSYRKFCDRDVAAWDALWLELRIDECDGRERP